MGNLSSFSKKMKKVSNEIESGVNKTIITACVLMDRNIVLSTPVDTGRARANWVVSLGGPDTSVQSYAKGSKKSTEQENTQNAINQAVFALGKRKPGQDVYLSNNLNYIGRLNEGSSTQAPAKFVQQGIFSAIRSIKNARILKNGN